MPTKPLRPCAQPGCTELVRKGSYCEQHRRAKLQANDRRRGSAQERGYTYRWSKYSKWFLSQPGNQVCRLRLDERCALVAQCVDHIVPPSGANDPLFWDTTNHQAACLVCNSIKGRKTIVGTEWEV
jgi:5-methylcytosine-specific restriction protein A